jgi:hypothetical protein
MEEQQTEALLQKEHLQALLLSPGWHILQAVFKTQIEARTNRVMLQPLGDDTGYTTVYQQEFYKGEAAGIRLVLELPKIMLESAEAIVDQTEKVENDDRLGKRDNERDDELGDGYEGF